VLLFAGVSQQNDARPISGRPRRRPTCLGTNPRTEKLPHRQSDVPRAFYRRTFERVSVWKVGKAPAVLIVEDEALIRLGAVRMIEDAGFEVIEAATADEAIQILESRGDIRVVFTDIHMPGSMDGLKLAHAVRNRWPPIKIIVTSGRELLTERDLPEGGRFLSKPYNRIEIRGALQGLAL
jgi:CheY-like chemotaxis protein